MAVMQSPEYQKKLKEEAEARKKKAMPGKAVAEMSLRERLNLLNRTMAAPSK